MAKSEQVKFVPRDLWINAHREEANQYEREGKIDRANRYRRYADRLQNLADSARAAKKRAAEQQKK